MKNTKRMFSGKFHKDCFMVRHVQMLNMWSVPLKASLKTCICSIPLPRYYHKFYLL